MFPLHNVPTDNSETKNVYSFICMGVGVGGTLVFRTTSKVNNL